MEDNEKGERLLPTTCSLHGFYFLQTSGILFGDKVCFAFTHLAQNLIVECVRKRLKLKKS